MKKAAIAILSLALLGGAALAQQSLSKSATLPKVDGSISASEYQFSTTMNGMKIAATLGSDDNLYLAVEAPSAGWAGAGIGGLVMNGSRLFLGSVLNGKSTFIEKAGKGHFYADAKDQVAKSWAVKTVGNTTTLELSLPASAAVWKGKINTIYAFSKSPQLDTRHQANARISFDVK
jgi:hypothetical protein